MRSTLGILIEARAVIALPENWGQGMRGGLNDRPLSTCCAAEAVEACTDVHAEKTAAYEALRRAIPGELSIIEWNDAAERTHADVLAAYDLAIATERGAQP